MTRPSANPAVRAALALSLWTLLVLCAPGCLLPILQQKTVGQEKVPAKYQPSKDDKMLVLVESYRAGGSGAAVGDVDAERTARYLVQNLGEAKTAPLVDLDELARLRDREGEHFRRLTIDQVGRAVGAKQVLYVNLESLNVEVPGGSNQGRGLVDAHAKIVDATTGATRWPADLQAGEPVHFQTELTATDDTADQTSIRRAACQQLADTVGRLLYGFRPEFGQPSN